MEIELGTPRIVRLEARLPQEELLRRAEEKRTAALGSGIGGLLQRPRAEEVELGTVQHRLDPLWHLAVSARSVYDRRRTYAVPVSAGDVRSVTLAAARVDIIPAAKGPATFPLEVLEHCVDEAREEIVVDGIGGAAVPDGLRLVSGPRTEVADTGELGGDEILVTSPEERASALVRQLLARLIRPLQADAILEEAIVVETLELCYRPVVAFEFRHAAKGRTGVVEADAITGEVRTATSLRAALGRRITKEFLFDVGAETAGLLVPGGGIAVKVARVVLDRG